LTNWNPAAIGRSEATRLSTEFGRGQFIFKLEDGHFAASEKRADGQAVGF